jgi:hypothetical protein
VATNRNIQRSLLQLKRGDIDFAMFHILTAQDWQRMAAKVHRRMKHRLGGSLDYDDILQEMLASVPESVEVYDPEAGSMTLGGFVVWRAFAVAKDHINQQCGAYKGRTSSPSRAPVASSVMSSRQQHGDSFEVFDVMLEDRVGVDPDQEWVAIVRECRDAVCKTLLDHVVMAHLIERGGCLQSIADDLYEDQSIRSQFDFTSRAIAYKTVKHVTREFVARAVAA